MDAYHGNSGVDAPSATAKSKRHRRRRVIRRGDVRRRRGNKSSHHQGDDAEAARHSPTAPIDSVDAASRLLKGAKTTATILVVCPSSDLASELGTGLEARLKGPRSIALNRLESLRPGGRPRRAPEVTLSSPDWDRAAVNQAACVVLAVPVPNAAVADGEEADFAALNLFEDFFVQLREVSARPALFGKTVVALVRYGEQAEAVTHGSVIQFLNHYRTAGLPVVRSLFRDDRVTMIAAAQPDALLEIIAARQGSGVGGPSLGKAPGLTAAAGLATPRLAVSGPSTSSASDACGLEAASGGVGTDLGLPRRRRRRRRKGHRRKGKVVVSGYDDSSDDDDDDDDDDDNDNDNDDDRELTGGGREGEGEAGSVDEDAALLAGSAPGQAPDSPGTGSFLGDSLSSGYAGSVPGDESGYSCYSSSYDDSPYGSYEEADREVAALCTSDEGSLTELASSTSSLGGDLTPASPDSVRSLLSPPPLPAGSAVGVGASESTGPVGAGVARSLPLAIVTSRKPRQVDEEEARRRAIVTPPSSPVSGQSLQAHQAGRRGSPVEVGRPSLLQLAARTLEGLFRTSGTSVADGDHPSDGAASAEVMEHIAVEVALEHELQGDGIVVPPETRARMAAALMPKQQPPQQPQHQQRVQVRRDQQRKPLSRPSGVERPADRAVTVGSRRSTTRVASESATGARRTMRSTQNAGGPTEAAYEAAGDDRDGSPRHRDSAAAPGTAVRRRLSSQGDVLTRGRRTMPTPSMSRFSVPSRADPEQPLVGYAVGGETGSTGPGVGGSGSGASGSAAVATSAGVPIAARPSGRDHRSATAAAVVSNPRSRPEVAWLPNDVRTLDGPTSAVLGSLGDLDDDRFLASTGGGGRGGYLADTDTAGLYGTAGTSVYTGSYGLYGSYGDLYGGGASPVSGGHGGSALGGGGGGGDLLSPVSSAPAVTGGFDALDADDYERWMSGYLRSAEPAGSRPGRGDLFGASVMGARGAGAVMMDGLGGGGGPVADETDVGDQDYMSFIKEPNMW